MIRVVAKTSLMLHPRRSFAVATLAIAALAIAVTAPASPFQVAPVAAAVGQSISQAQDATGMHRASQSVVGPSKTSGVQQLAYPGQPDEFPSSVDRNQTKTFTIYAPAGGQDVYITAVAGATTVERVTVTATLNGITGVTAGAVTPMLDGSRDKACYAGGIAGGATSALTIVPGAGRIVYAMDQTASAALTQATSNVVTGAVDRNAKCGPGK